MKKILFLIIMVICCAAAQAATYRVTYDVINQKKVSFTVTVNSDRLTIGQNVYSLRQLGTISNSGLVFNSYMYGQNQNMFCVSTTSVTVDKALAGDLMSRIVANRYNYSELVALEIEVNEKLNNSKCLLS